jgi:(2Fe-2S) ferredoxin
MPEGVFYKGMTHAPASAIIEQHHLSFWLPEEEY